MITHNEIQKYVSKRYSLHVAGGAEIVDILIKDIIAAQQKFEFFSIEDIADYCDFQEGIILVED